MVPQLATGLGPIGTVSAASVDPKTRVTRTPRLPRGRSMVLGPGAAIKGCAPRTGKPASALDRDARSKRMAMMPLWRVAGSRTIIVDHYGPHVRALWSVAQGS